MNELIRENRIKDLNKEINKNKACLIVYGSAGIGKSIFLNQVNNHLSKNGAFSLFISFNWQEKKILQELLDFTKKILGIKQVIQKTLEDLNKNKLQYIRGLTFAIIKDVVNTTLPLSEIKKLETYKKLAKTLEKGTSIKDIEEQIQNLKYELFPTLISILNEISNYTKKDIYLIFDQVSENSKAYIDWIRNSIKESNHGLFFLLAVQDEEYQSNKEFYALIQSVARHTISSYKLSGFTIEEINSWFSINDFKLTTSQSKNLHKITEGKPIYLEQCIYAKEINFERLKKDISEKEGGYFDDLFSEFKSHEKSIIISLCFQPQNYILSDSILLKMTGINDDDFDSFVKHYERTNLLSRDGLNEFVRLNLHSNITSYILKTYRNHAVKIASKLKTQFEDYGNFNNNELKHFCNIIVFLQHEPEYVFENIYKLLQEELNKEEMNIPFYWVDKLIQLELPENKKIVAHTIYAKFCYYLGEYAKAIDKTQLDKNVLMKASLSEYGNYKLYQGRNYFALSQYEQALEKLRFSSVIFQELEDWDNYIESVKTIATIHRDRSEYHEAYEISNSLYNSLVVNSNIILKPQSTSYICRNYVRSVIMADKNDDVETPLNLAFSVLNDNKSTYKRAIGNCYFAQGEMLRYNHKFQECILSYNEAIKLAKEINNPDLEIYSNLGICASSIHLRDFSLFIGGLKELMIILKIFKHPLEILHMQFLFHVNELLIKRKEHSYHLDYDGELLELNTLLGEYDKRGVSWAEKYWNTLGVDGIDTSNIMKF